MSNGTIKRAETSELEEVKIVCPLMGLSPDFVVTGGNQCPIFSVANTREDPIGDVHFSPCPYRDGNQNRCPAIQNCGVSGLLKMYGDKKIIFGGQEKTVLSRYKRIFREGS